MPEREAALARGFVLGDDDGIDAAHARGLHARRARAPARGERPERDPARPAAMPLLGADRACRCAPRLVWMLGLIAVYVPLTGAGPSIQRAGVMGAAGLVATLAGRPRSRSTRWLLAAIVTLALDPRVGARRRLAAQLRRGARHPPLRPGACAALLDGRRAAAAPRRALAEGAAMTVAATRGDRAADRHHFGDVSTGSLLANLLALPAVAPAMWLGMLAAAAGQVPGLPVEPLNGLDSAALAYVAQVAAWCGAPRLGARARSSSAGSAGWSPPTPAIGASAGLALRRSRGPRASAAAGVALAALAVAAVALGARAQAGGRLRRRRPRTGLRVTVLDVGQGDAILLQPPDGARGPGRRRPAGRRLSRACCATSGVERPRRGRSSPTTSPTTPAGSRRCSGAFPVARSLYGRLDRR